MKTRWLCLFTIFFCAAVTAGAADWPQWRGPDRTGISKETGLLKAWPKGGPQLLWTCADVGIGYSAFSVVGDRLYTMGGTQDSEFVYAVDVNTGKRLWESRVGELFKEGHGNGPRGTPTIDGELLYAIGGKGDLLCAETATGKQRWTVSMPKALGGRIMSGWGYCESPLVDGDLVICMPGSEQGTLAALDKKTGKVQWRCTELKDRASHASGIIVEIHGVRQIVQMTSNAAVGVAVKDGKLLWRYGKGDYGNAVIPTPNYHDNHVYLTNGYRIGCDLIKIEADGQNFKATKVYDNRNMTNHHGGVIRIGDHLYGYFDGEKAWVCKDFHTGKVVWKESRLGKGSVTCADGHFYCFGERDANCVLIKASPEGWQETGRFKIPQESKVRSRTGMTWTHPVVANGKLYLRDQELLFCYDVRDRAVRN